MFTCCHPSILRYIKQSNTCFFSGQHHVNCPSQPILATVGEDIILPAYLEPATNAKTIEWTRPDLSPRYVHVQRQGVKLTDNHPSYEGRTSLLSDELKLGNISLKLSRVRISDEGPYRCFLPEMKISCIIQLVVGERIYFVFKVSFNI